MMVSSRPSTSSRVQARRSEFCDISSPETATPPAITPLAVSFFAASPSISFWVAHGRATSALTDQTPSHPAVYLALGYFLVYSEMRPHLRVHQEVPQGQVHRRVRGGLVRQGRRRPPVRHPERDGRRGREEAD